jgi:uncharacterized cupin superfamily protein
MSFEDVLSGRGFVRGRDEGAAIVLPGGWSMRIKVGAADTGGAMTLIEGAMAAGHAGPMEHVHVGHDEAFFVIEGELRFRIGDGARIVTAGETVFASRGSAHGFSNPGVSTARYLVALTPAGYEVYFARLAELIRREGAMPTRDRLIALMAEHGTFPA